MSPSRNILIGGIGFLLFLVSGVLDAQTKEGPRKGLGGQPPVRREQRHVFLHGKVILDDGREPGDRVQVRLICHGSVYRQTHAASSGDFSLEIGPGRDNVFSQPVMDASVSYYSTGTNPARRAGHDIEPPGFMVETSDYTSVNLTGCELQAHLSGYQSEAVRLGHRGALDSGEVGVIVLHRVGEAEGTMVSLKSLAAPKKARKSYQKAVEELQEEDPDSSEAVARLVEAVEEYPEFAAAWNLLGRIRLAQSDDEGARQAFRQAIAADAQYVEPYLLLSEIEMRQDRWEPLVELTEQVLALDPSLAAAHYFHAVGRYELGELNTAQTSLQYLEENDQMDHFPLACYLSGVILFRQGDIPAAAAYLRRFLDVNANPGWGDQVRLQLREWEQQGLITADKEVPR